MIQRTGPRPKDEEICGAYELRVDAMLAPGERRRVVNTPTVVAFRTTRIVVSRDFDVDTITVHNMITNGKSENRHASVPCSLGNLLVRLPVAQVILGRCEIGNEVGFEVENKTDHEQRFSVTLLGEGFRA
jgi:hypothetical protein